MEYNFRKKGDDEITYLNTVISYQDSYIRRLEHEIYNLMGEERLNFHREENHPESEYSIITKSKIEAIFRTAYSLKKKIDQITSDSKIPMEKILEHNCPLPDTYLYRALTIGISHAPLLMGDKQVILKWNYGKEEFANAMYLRGKEIEDIGCIGYIIEKFFFEVCRSRIKHIKGEK